MYFSIFNATFNINDRKLKNNIGEYSHKKLFLEKVHKFYHKLH